MKLRTAIASILLASTLVCGPVHAGPRFDFQLNEHGFTLRLDKGKDRHVDRRHRARRYAHRRCSHWLRTFHDTGDRFYVRMYRQCFKHRERFYLNNR